MQLTQLTSHPAIKPGIWGAVIGAAAISIVGFGWMGWTTASTAASMARDQADAAVVVALVPFCVANAKSDTDSAKLTKFHAEEASYKRDQMVQDSGWATMPGSKTADFALARACSEKLQVAKAN